MKFDVDHSTPYYRSIFERVPEEIMTDNSNVMKSLSTYHKRQHFLLNYGAAHEYKPPSWSETDNVFPVNAPVNPMTHIEWGAFIRQFDKDNTKGDVLEFGVACAGTIRDIAFINPEKTIYGFDHFQGLEQTKQQTPDYAGWYKGAFRLEGSEYKQTYDQVLEDCGQFPNVTLVVKDIHELDDPSAYGISKISAVHIDVDIYEPTVSALNFVDKCEWDQLYMRFDDWHGHEPDYDHHERKAFREWLTKHGYKFEIYEDGISAGAKVWK